MRKLLALFFLCASAAFAQTSQNGRIMEGALATRPTVCSNSDVFIANDSDPPLNFQCGSSNNWLAFAGGGGGGTPGGTNTMVQYNCGGVFCGDANFEWDFTNKNLTVAGNARFKGPQPWVDVTAFGAVGDGATDDTAAIGAAIAFACANGSATVFFPPVSNFYKVIQIQAGTSATAAIYPITCSNLHLKGGNSRGDNPSFKQGPGVSIQAFSGASPNPGPVFSIIKQTGVTIEDLIVNGYNEAIYVGDAGNNVGGATNNITFINVNTKVNTTGIGTATQPNAAEVYGGGLWYTANGGSAAVGGTFNGNSIVILNDTPGQPPGIIQMRDRVLINCIDAKSIGVQTGTAGNWNFENVTSEDCNNGYFVIDDDGVHPWALISNITIDKGGTSDSSYSSYFTLNSNVTVIGLRISQPSGLAFGASLITKTTGNITFASSDGAPVASGSVIVDGSGNLSGSMYAANGFGLDIFSTSTASGETDVQTNSQPTGGFRAFQAGSPVASSFATVNTDPYFGYGMGLATTYGPEVALKTNAAGSFDVDFPTAYAPTSLAASPTTGGTLANGLYYYFVMTSTSGNCSTGVSAPSLSASVTLAGANNAVALTWVLPGAGTGTIQGFCVFWGTSSQGPKWSVSAQYHGGQFVAGAGTTSYTNTGFGTCCTANHVPIASSFSGAHRFTATSIGVNTTSPAYNLDANGTGHYAQYVDFTEIAAPANPSAGIERVWADNSTHLLTCKVSSGAACSSGGGGGGSFQVNGVGLISSTTVNFLNSAATNGVTYTFTNTSAGNIQLGASGTLTIAGGGTGATTKTAAFDALSPTTTQGDIILNNGTNNVRLGIGTNNQVLTSNGTTASWQTPSTVTGSGTATYCAFWSSSTAITGSANCTYSAASGISLIQGANAADMIYGKRATDSSPTGNFFHFQNAAANSDVATLDVSGNLSIAQQLTTGTGAATHFVKIPEGTTAGAATGFDVLSGDSTNHCLSVSNNNLGFSCVGLFASSTLTAHSVMVSNTTFPLMTQVAPGSAGSCFVSNGAGADPSFQGCVGSVNFNNILAATGANTVNNTNFPQLWQWKLTTNSTNGLEISEPTASTATTASLFVVDTLASSTLFPVTFTAQGTANGVQMSTAGVLGAIGSGGINATLCNSATCVGTATGTANTIPKFTGAAAIANSLLSDNATTLTYTGVGGIAFTSANAFISDTEGTAPAGSAGADLLWADSTAHAWKFINNNGSAFIVPAAQTCTNQVVTVTNATGGTCTTITSAYVNTSVAVTGGDINTSSQVVSTHITGGTSNTIPKFSAGNLVNSDLTDNGTQIAAGERFNMTTFPLVSDVTNDGTTGTTTSGLAKFTSTGAINILVSDTSIPVYIIQSGGAVGGTAQFVQAGGQGDCRMDLTTAGTEGKEGNFVVASTSVATDCHPQSAQPAAGLFIVGTLISASTTAGATSKVAVLNTFSALGSNTTCSPNAFPNTQTDGATVTWAIASAVCANATLTFTVHSGSRTLNLTGLVNGGNYVLKLIQDGTGGESLTGGTGCTWKQRGGAGTAFTLTSAPNALDVLAFTYDGTNCVANIGLNYN